MFRLAKSYPVLLSLSIEGGVHFDEGNRQLGRDLSQAHRGKGPNLSFINTAVRTSLTNNAISWYFHQNVSIVVGWVEERNPTIQLIVTQATMRKTLGFLTFSYLIVPLIITSHLCAASLYVDLGEARRRRPRLFVETESEDTRVRVLNIRPGFYEGMELDPARYHAEVLASGHVFTSTVGMKFVYISPGTFVMGSPINEKGRDSDERQHRVTLTKGFYMQTTEVTVGQWRAFVQDTAFMTEAETEGRAWIYTGREWEKKKGYYWDNPGFYQSENHPVTCVSWNDAQAFVEWLRHKEGKAYRLPTEAEWEYACRAGSDRAFANGGITDPGCGHDPSLDNIGWYCGNSGKKTHAVGHKKPNAWGLYDMHGNVWEWCQDWYGEYPSGHVTDPEGRSPRSYRVNRGGSWSGHVRYCRSAFRILSSPDQGNSGLGFRLARTK
jgi:formylglycine-generating enzyme required for sulfatase activity